VAERAASSLGQGEGRHLEPVDLGVEAAPGAIVLEPRPSSRNGLVTGPPKDPANAAHQDLALKLAGPDELADHDEGSATSGPPHGAAIRAGLKQAGPLALAGFAANGANVLVTLALARLLSTRGYGALAQLTSLFLVVSMPGTAVVVGVVRRVTALAVSGHDRPVGRWARRAHARATIAVAAFAVLALSLRGPVAHLLSIPAPLGVFAAVSAGGVWILLSLDRGLLQARRSYQALAANLVVEGGVRTVAVLSFVGAGMGVTGAAWGILVAEVVTAIHARIAADRLWAVGESVRARGTARLATWVAVVIDPSPVGERSFGSARQLHRMFLDLSAALVAMALLAYLQNVDVIVLSRAAPHFSGSYAAISVASKAIVFGAIALGGYLLPEAAIEWHRGGHALRQLVVTFLVLAVPGSALLCASVVFPRRLLSLVFSSRYVGAQSAFAFLAIAMVFLSVTVILTLYLLAAGQRWIGGVLLVGAVVATVVLAAAHGSPRPTASADLVVQAVLAATTAAAFALTHSRRAGRALLDPMRA
jgi:O-antigen/teichoic acid export membrane protein